VDGKSKASSKNERPDRYARRECIADFPVTGWVCHPAASSTSCATGRTKNAGTRTDESADANIYLPPWRIKEAPMEHRFESGHTRQIGSAHVACIGWHAPR